MKSEKKTRFPRRGETWFLTIVLFLLCVPNQVAAQTSALTITIITPNENETFYSSPSTLLYSIAIKGWVATQHPEPSLVRVRLEILRDGIVTGSATTRADSTGAFLFDVTVDPTAPRGEFTIAEVENGCENCHYAADLALPSGKILLRVTAIEPAGRQAMAERRVIVDRSTYTTVPVRVVRTDQPDQPLANVPVSGAARLYLWRTRHQTSVTNAAGQARLQIEVLSQSPTRYVFRVEPSVVDGKLVASVEPITITLTPNAPPAPITLRVSSRTGEIFGTLDRAIKPIAVRAIRLSDGASYTTQTTTTSTFAFANLPIAQYLILADDRALAEQGFASAPQTIDLAAAPTTTITVPLVAAARGNSISGSVRDAKGAALPFAWVALEPAAIARVTALNTGEFWLSDAPQRNAKFTIVASAPGYYHQAQVVDGTTPAHFALTRRPETQTIAWGSGEIIAPPESQVRVEPQTIALEYGWLWGSGDRRGLTLRVADATITLSAGKFAVEYFPDRNVAWFYLIEGTATVRAKNETDLRAGEMIALANAPITPAPLDADVIAALHPANTSPIAPTWEPSLAARARDQLAQMGISVAQATTFVTYSIIVLILVLSPLSAAMWWWRHRAR